MAGSKPRGGLDGRGPITEGRVGLFGEGDAVPGLRSGGFLANVAGLFGEGVSRERSNDENTMADCGEIKQTYRHLSPMPDGLRAYPKSRPRKEGRQWCQTKVNRSITDG